MEKKPITLDNAVKVSIIAGALIVALSIAYYSVIFLPQKEKVRLEEQKQNQQILIEKEQALNDMHLRESCANKSDKIKENIDKMRKNGILSVVSLLDIFYSSKINDCIYITRSTSYYNDNAKSRIVIQNANTDALIDYIDEDTKNSNDVKKIIEEYR